MRVCSVNFLQGTVGLFKENPTKSQGGLCCWGEWRRGVGYNPEKPSNRIPAGGCGTEPAAARNTGSLLLLAAALEAENRPGPLRMNPGNSLQRQHLFWLWRARNVGVGHSWVWILALPRISNWARCLVILNSLTFL